jgi:DNA-binding MarR family transcriptional regulator
MDMTIPFLMADTARLFRRLFDQRAREIGVTGQQWRALAVIARNPGLNQGNAAELLEVEPITLSRMIDRLGELGLVERRAAPNDRRAWCLYLSDKAVPMIEEMRMIARDLGDVALTDFTTEERKLFLRYIERFRSNLPTRQQDDDRPSEPRAARVG